MLHHPAKKENAKCASAATPASAANPANAANPAKITITSLKTSNLQLGPVSLHCKLQEPSILFY